MPCLRLVALFACLVGFLLSPANAEIIGGRPAGCPHAYCGCGARLYLGIDDPRLNLASNWPRYYRGSALIAVWRHHVAIVERMTSPHTAILRDYNSGGHLSRLHERSIVGARIIGGNYTSNYSAPAVHHKARTRHEARRIRHQESDRAFQLAQFREPAHW